MWAFMCGVVSSGASLGAHWGLLLSGIFLAGPLICATSQAVNDWFDRDVDAINEPGRPIPSGRIPGHWGLWIAIIWTLVSLMFSTFLGIWVVRSAMLGLILSWAYSAPPFRLKRSGWLGPAAVGFSYEGLTWFTGAAVMTGVLPQGHVIFLAVAYSIGAYGIMTLNDFKAVAGDRQTGIRSLPAELGVDNAALIACAMMAIPQFVVVIRVATWGRPGYAIAISLLLMGQLILMRRLLNDPRKNAPWYNTTGTMLYVLGMLVSAFAVRTMHGG
jgi:chlorophyll synthase